jgi:hypothetical protein
MDYVIGAVFRSGYWIWNETSIFLIEISFHLDQELLSAYQEKIPASNAIYAHAQDFASSDELLLAIQKAFIPQLLNEQQTTVFHVFWCIQCDSV